MNWSMAMASYQAEIWPSRHTPCVVQLQESSEATELVRTEKSWERSQVSIAAEKRDDNVDGHDVES